MFLKNNSHIKLRRTMHTGVSNIQLLKLTCIHRRYTPTASTWASDRFCPAFLPYGTPKGVAQMYMDYGTRKWRVMIYTYIYIHIYIYIMGHESGTAPSDKAQIHMDYATIEHRSIWIMGRHTGLRQAIEFRSTWIMRS